MIRKLFNWLFNLPVETRLGETCRRLKELRTGGNKWKD